MADVTMSATFLTLAMIFALGLPFAKRRVGPGLRAILQLPLAAFLLARPFWNLQLRLPISPDFVNLVEIGSCVLIVGIALVGLVLDFRALEPVPARQS